MTYLLALAAGLCSIVGTYAFIYSSNWLMSVMYVMLAVVPAIAVVLYLRARSYIARLQRNCTYLASERDRIDEANTEIKRKYDAAVKMLNETSGIMQGMVERRRVEVHHHDQLVDALREELGRVKRLSRQQRRLSRLRKEHV